MGSASKHTAASNNLVFTSFSSLKRLAEVEKRFSHAGLYQGIAQNLIRGLKTNQALADFVAKLASVADDAHQIRQFEVVGHVGRLLLNLPLFRHLESVGLYYEALSLNQGTRGDTVSAGSIFHQIADIGPLHYRARAMLALGANSFTAGDRQTAMSFYREVMRIVTRRRVFDPATLYTASRMTAVIKGMEGDHRGAAADLGRMLPLARMASSVQPYAYYDYLNTLAVELLELGRIEPARRASEIAVASPFANAYPEWHETRNEIASKDRGGSRSSVVVRQPISETDKDARYLGLKKDNLLRLPAPEPRAPAGRADYPQDTQARVLNFQQWKTAIKASSRAIPEEVTPEQRRRMTTGEKLIRLMDLISQDETDDETIDRILEAVEGIVLNRRNEKLD
jgi:tetratricopeptide (TPR) repeat protein